MKKLAVLTFLTLSLNAQAASFFLPTLLTSAGDDFKVAEVILNDSQDFLQTGKLSLILAEKVSLLQSENSDLSIEDAVDLLIEQNLDK